MEYKKESNRIYVLDEKGACIAEVLFPEVGANIYDITHTFVDDSLRGQGVAGELVRRAAEEITARGGTFRTSCSYAAAWRKRHAK